MSRAATTEPPAPARAAPPTTSETRVAAGALLRGRGLLEPHLLIVAGPGTGLALRLGKDQTVGRGRRADLRIPDPSASRLHLRLSRVDGRFVAADLDSKNGLRVNDRPCRGALALAAGDELSLGTTRLRLEPGLLEQAPRSREDPPAASVAPLSGTGEEGPAPSVTARQVRRSCTQLLASAAALAALAATLLALP
jgi:pSer/pThr/pTyr-binding forkhead associated (FHA) protein